MPGTKFEIKNAIACDDVRDEVGGKKSLMGVFSGDILVQNFPAHIQVALYFEIIGQRLGDACKLIVSLFVDKERLGQANMDVQFTNITPVASIIIPKGIILFDKEGSALRVAVKIDNDPEIEILNKKVLLNPSSASTTDS